MLHIGVRGSHGKGSTDNRLAHTRRPLARPCTAQLTSPWINLLGHIHINLAMSRLDKAIGPLRFIRHTLTDEHTTERTHAAHVQLIELNIVPEPLHQAIIVLLHLSWIGPRSAHLLKRCFTQTNVSQRGAHLVKRKTVTSLTCLDTLQAALQGPRQLTAVLLLVLLDIAVHLLTLVFAPGISHVFNRHASIACKRPYLLTEVRRQEPHRHAHTE